MEVSIDEQLEAEALLKTKRLQEMIAEEVKDAMHRFFMDYYASQIAGRSLTPHILNDHRFQEAVSQAITSRINGTQYTTKW